MRSFVLIIAVLAIAAFVQGASIRKKCGGSNPYIDNKLRSLLCKVHEDRLIYKSIPSSSSSSSESSSSSSESSSSSSSEEVNRDKEKGNGCKDSSSSSSSSESDSKEDRDSSCSSSSSEYRKNHSHKKPKSNSHNNSKKDSDSSKDEQIKNAWNTPSPQQLENALSAIAGVSQQLDNADRAAQEIINNNLPSFKTPTVQPIPDVWTKPSSQQFLSGSQWENAQPALPDVSQQLDNADPAAQEIINDNLPWFKSSTVQPIPDVWTKPSSQQLLSGFQWGNAQPALPDVSQQLDDADPAAQEIMNDNFPRFKSPTVQPIPNVWTKPSSQQFLSGSQWENAQPALPDVSQQLDNADPATQEIINHNLPWFKSPTVQPIPDVWTKRSSQQLLSGFQWRNAQPALPDVSQQLDNKETGQ